MVALTYSFHFAAHFKDHSGNVQAGNKRWLFSQVIAARTGLDISEIDTRTSHFDQYLVGFWDRLGKIFVFQDIGRSQPGYQDAFHLCISLCNGK